MSIQDPRFTRRRFLQGAATVAAASALPAWYLEESQSYAATPVPLSPNDRPGIGWVGCGGRGSGIIQEAKKFGDVLAICDVDARHLEVASKTFPKAKPYRDFRQLIDRDDIHVIITSTPDQWHTLVNLRALKSGKDVYSEKPLTRTIEEGKRLVATANATKRLVQTGSQQRSDRRFRLACELVRNGRLGKLKTITTLLPAGRHGGPFKSTTPPPELDWNFWTGPARFVDYVPERCHGNFRYWYDYSDGTMTDWGAHHNDIAQWGNGTERTGPISAEGKPLIDEIPGGYTAASQYHVEYQYANGVRLVCMSVITDGPDGSHHGASSDTVNGIRFEGTDGWIFVTRGDIEASNPELLTQPLPANAQRLYVSNDHMGNFFDCVRTRKQPICEAEIGHRSVSVCHIGTIAMRLGRKLEWDPAREEFKHDQEANAFVSPEMRAPWTFDSV